MFSYLESDTPFALLLSVLAKKLFPEPVGAVSITVDVLSKAFCSFTNAFDCKSVGW